MTTRIAYGRGELEVRLPTGSVELATTPVTPLGDPAEATRLALQHPVGTPPLGELARRARQRCPPGAASRPLCVVVVSDITRPVPNRLLLPPVLDALEPHAGRIVLLVATGMHRKSTASEKEEMLGRDVLARCEVVDHDAGDRDQLIALPGRTPAGSPVHVNRLYAEGDLKVLTGLVEPHFMAGYSGGRKAICPGLLDLASIQRFHGPGVLEDPRAASGVLQGNPCHEEARAIARHVGADFLLNVALDRQRRVVGVFAGGLDAAFRAAVGKVDSYCRVRVDEPADIVVTSGGGYPLDQTFYQTVKGMVGALPAARKGGCILIASACTEGIGSPEYARLMFRYAGRHEAFLADILARPEVERDQWEFEEQCKVLAHVREGGLVVCTDGIQGGTLRRCSVTPASELAGPSTAGPAEELQGALDALVARHPGARVAAIPEGPYALVAR